MLKRSKIIKKKKGFTLIEVIAIIIILGIISTIAIITIKNVIEDAKKEAYKVSVEHLFSATETFLFLNGNELTNEGIEANSITTLDNNKFISGIIFLNDNGNYEVNDVSDGDYCANGEIDNLHIIKGACDQEKPNIELSINKNIVTAHFTDNKQLMGYACTDNSNKPNKWLELSGKDDTKECTFDSIGTYYVHAIDATGNTQKESFVLDQSAFDYTATVSTSTYTASYGEHCNSACTITSVYNYNNCLQAGGGTSTDGRYHSGSCANGQTKNNSICGYGVSVGEQYYYDCYMAYSCPSGGTLSGTTCTITTYTCPNGGTLDGTTCKF